MFIARCHHNLRLTAIWSQDDVDSETKKNMPCQLSEYATIAPASFLPEFSSMTLRALLYRRPTEPQAIEVVCDGAVHLVRLRRHRQARRYTLRVVAVTREAVLTMPPRGSFREAREFAEKHGAWIAARLDRLSAIYDTIRQIADAFDLFLHVYNDDINSTSLSFRKSEFKTVEDQH